jgi:hypothetical protein
MKVLKTFYSIDRKEKFYEGDEIKDPLKKWIDQGLVEAPKKKEEKKANDTKELKSTRNTKFKK